MPRPKKKPEYDKEQIMKSLMQAVSDCYTSSEEKDTSLRQVAAEFDMTHLKARKLLITAGAFSSDICDEIQELKAEGKTIPEIMKVTGLSRASVHSYLPYTKVIYNAKELSLNAERLKKFRVRQEAVNEIEQRISAGAGDISDIVWDAMQLFQNYTFYTTSDQKFRYFIYNGELIVLRKETHISREDIVLALENVIKEDYMITETDQLGVPAATYIYSIFRRLGII